MSFRWLLITVVICGTGSPSEARVVCPPGFAKTPKAGVTCVQRDCVEVGGAYDRALACTCGGNKACTTPVKYKKKTRAQCKDCPANRVVACVPKSQPCPEERKVACKGDGDCPDCTYCKDGQCTQATAIIATTGSTKEGGRHRRVGWRRSRVAFWSHKAWVARWLWMQGCRLKFRDLEDPEMLAELIAAENVKALAYFGHCTKKSLRKRPKPKKASSIFGAREGGKTQPRYFPTMEGMTANDLRADVVEVIEERVARKLRKKRVRRAKAKKKAKEAAKQRTQTGWLHFLLNSTCHSLDDNSMADTLVRPGGIYWGRKGTRPLGLALDRHEKPK